MMRTLRRALFLAGILTTGCSDGGASGPAIGTWQHYDPQDGSPDFLVTFDADGSWQTATSDGDTGSGDWNVDGDELTMSWRGDDGTDSRTFTYHADEQVMFEYALLPDGEVDGLVGRWRGHQHIAVAGTGPVDLTQVLQVSADGSASFDQTGEGDGELENHWSGTWSETDDGVEFEYVDDETGSTAHPGYRTIPGVMLSNQTAMTRID